ncbi:MAG: adenosine-specific kinase [Candidatus Thermoplasmatota archaeon]|nr:adenosine-specific kinase [Candidatus Thermoplasmatota archaeon]
MELKTIKIQKPPEVNIILGQSHFIKTVEDLHEVLITSVPQIKFGIAFCESSGACLVRISGNDDALKKLAAQNAFSLACGHSFIILLKNAYPINVLNAIKHVSEICNIYCATANDIEVIVAETSQGRGVLGVVDGSLPRGIEAEKDIIERKEFLRKLGYKL